MSRLCSGLRHFFLLGTIDTWQLIINTVTTIVTFLLVALLQTHRNAPTTPFSTNAVQHNAVQHKLNAIADGLADLMKQLSKEHLELGKDLKELRMALDSKITKVRPEPSCPRMRPLRLQNL